MRGVIFTAFGEYKKIAGRFCQNADFIIAADGGFSKAKSMGIIPHLVIGDMDSLDIDIDACIETKRVNPIKDDTDTLLCIKECISRKINEIVILGGLGGRLDHTLANMQSLKFIYENGARGIIADDFTQVLYIKNEKIQLDNSFKYVSFFSLSEKASGISLTGFKYPLKNATLTNSFPLGVSNEILEKNAAVDLKDGELYIVKCN